MQNASKNVVYSPKWQLLRMQLKGNWTHDILSNLNSCDEYLGDRSDISKMWRVLNMLNAVRMGFHGMGIIDSSIDKILVAYRDKVSDDYAFLTDIGAQYEEVTEERVRAEWAEISLNWQEAIIEDLSIRYLKSGKSKSREDLKWFLHLVGADL